MSVSPLIDPQWSWVYAVLVGQQWPEGDEDELRGAAQAWTDAINGLLDIADGGNITARNVNYSVRAVSADQFNAYWEQWVNGDNSYIGELAKQCEVMAGNLLRQAQETEYTKLTINITVVIVIIQLAVMLVMAAATAGGSLTGWAIALFFGKQAVLEAILRFVEQVIAAVLPDVIAQSIMMANGHESSWDWGKTGQAVAGGVVGGVVGTLAGAAGGKLFGKAIEDITTDTFAGKAGKFLAETTLHSAEGAFTNGATSLITAAGTSIDHSIEDGHPDQIWSNLVTAEKQAFMELPGQLLSGAGMGAAFHIAHTVGSALSPYHGPVTTLTMDNGKQVRAYQSDSGYKVVDENGFPIGTGSFAKDGATFTLDRTNGQTHTADLATGHYSVTDEHGTTTTHAGWDPLQGTFTDTYTTHTAKTDLPVTNPDGSVTTIKAGSTVTHHGDLNGPVIQADVPKGSTVERWTLGQDGNLSMTGWQKNTNFVGIGTVHTDYFAANGDKVATYDGWTNRTDVTDQTAYHNTFSDAVDRSANGSAQLSIQDSTSHGGTNHDGGTSTASVTTPATTPIAEPRTQHGLVESSPTEQPSPGQDVPRNSAQIPTDHMSPNQPDRQSGQQSDKSRSEPRRDGAVTLGAAGGLDGPPAEPIRRAADVAGRIGTLFPEDHPIHEALSRFTDELARSQLLAVDGVLPEAVRGHLADFAELGRSVTAPDAPLTDRGWVAHIVDEVRNRADALAQLNDQLTGTQPHPEPVLPEISDHRLPELPPSEGTVHLGGTHYASEPVPEREWMSLGAKEEPVAMSVLDGKPLSPDEARQVQKIGRLIQKTIGSRAAVADLYKDRAPSLGGPADRVNPDRNAPLLDANGNETGGTIGGPVLGVLAVINDGGLVRARLRDLAAAEPDSKTAAANAMYQAHERSTVFHPVDDEHDPLLMFAFSGGKHDPVPIARSTDQYGQLLGPYEPDALTINHITDALEAKIAGANNVAFDHFREQFKLLSHTDIADLRQAAHGGPDVFERKLAEINSAGRLPQELATRLSDMMKRSIPDRTRLRDRLDRYVRDGVLDQRFADKLVSLAVDPARFNQELADLAGPLITEEERATLLGTQQECDETRRQLVESGRWNGDTADKLGELAKLDPAAFRAVVDRLFQPELASALSDLRATRVDRFLDDLAARAAVVSDVVETAKWAYDRPLSYSDVIASEVDKVLKGRLEVEQYIDRFDPVSDDPFYRKVVDALAVNLNRRPPMSLPSEPPKEFGLTAEEWQLAKDAYQLDTHWPKIRDHFNRIRSLGDEFQAHSNQRGTDAEAKMISMLRRVFERTPPPKDAIIVVSADKAMCQSCQKLARDFGLRVVVTGEGVEYNPRGFAVDKVASGAALHGWAIPGKDVFGPAQTVKPRSGRYNLFGHADEHGFLGPKGSHLTADEMAGLVPPEQVPKGATIVAYACNLANGTAPYDLAAKYQREIVAANRPVWIDKKGNAIAASMVVDSEGREVPKIPPDGHWFAFSPDGLRRQLAEGDPLAPEIPVDLLPDDRAWNRMDDQSVNRMDDLQTKLAEEPGTQDDWSRLGGQQQQHDPQRQREIAELESKQQELHQRQPVLAQLRTAISTVDRLVKIRDDLRKLQIEALQSRYGGGRRERFTMGDARNFVKAQLALDELDHAVRSAAGFKSSQAHLDQVLAGELSRTNADAATIRQALRAWRIGRGLGDEKWTPQRGEQIDRELTTLFNERGKLSFALRSLEQIPGANPEELARVHERMKLIGVEIGRLKQQRAEYQHKIEEKAKQILAEVHAGGDPAEPVLKKTRVVDIFDRRNDAERHPNRIAHALAPQGSAPGRPSLDDVRRVVDNHLFMHDQEMAMLRDRLNALRPNPNADPRSALFDPLAAHEAQVVSTRTLKNSQSGGRNRAVPLPDNQQPDIGNPHGRALWVPPVLDGGLVHGVIRLVTGTFDDVRTLGRIIVKRDWEAVAGGILGSNRHDEKQVEHVVQEVRLPDGTTYIRDMRRFEITDTRAGLFDALLTKRFSRSFLPSWSPVSAEASQSVAVVPAGTWTTTWERTEVRWALKDDPNNHGYPRSGAMQRDTPATTDVDLTSSLKIKSAFEGSVKNGIPVAPTGMYVGGKGAARVAHTETIPVEPELLVARFGEEVGRLAARGPLLGLDIVRGFAEDLRSAKPKSTIEGELSYYLKQPLLGPAAKPIEDATGLPATNLTDLTLIQHTHTWSLKPAKVPDQVAGLGRILDDVLAIPANPARGVPDLIEHVKDLLHEFWPKHDPDSTATPAQAQAQVPGQVPGQVPTPPAPPANQPIPQSRITVPLPRITVPLPKTTQPLPRTTQQLPNTTQPLRARATQPLHPSVTRPLREEEP